MDTVSKRYGIMPSDIADLPIEEYNLNILTASVGIKEEIRQTEKANKQARSRKR